MKRKLAAFGLAFSLAQLAAAYLPSLAVWLATAFSFVFAGLTALQKRKLTSVVLLTVAACLGFAAHLVYEPLAVQPVLELAGRQVRVVATAGTDSETSYQEDRLRGTLHITELDGEPADLLVTCASFPGSRPGEIFSATLELQNLDEDSYRMNYFSDGVFLQAEYVGEYAYLGESTTLEFILYRIRQELSRRLMTWLPTEEGGVEAAMLIGDTSRLSELQEENFRTAGVSHLLAACDTALQPAGFLQRKPPALFPAFDSHAGNFAAVLPCVDRIPGFRRPGGDWLSDCLGRLLFPSASGYAYLHGIGCNSSGTFQCLLSL